MSTRQHPLADMACPQLASPPAGPPRTLHWEEPDPEQIELRRMADPNWHPEDLPPVRLLWGESDWHRPFGPAMPTGWRTWIFRLLRWFARWF